MPGESLAIKLRQARGAMSLAEAAEQSEIPEERIRMYEEGVRRPYGKTLRRLADVYGLRVAELVGAAVGRVIRPRPRAQEVRRRRRRITATAEEGSTISVPLEVAEGQTVRLVIELVVRRRQDEVVDEAYPSYAADGPRQARPSSPERLVVEAELPPVEVNEPERSDFVRRRLRVAEDSPRQTRDPILELKRAYSDFRQKKP